MRILAIRGENIASLAGAFELSLAEGPLAHIGLFSITGPTGAGKSTLLDAMCLALFDNTPRLASHASTVLVGRDGDDTTRLRAGDPRSLVRKGAGFGFAEVDYEGRDGKRYRARWEARRARSQPSGKFQNQNVTLREIASDAVLGGTKTETLAEIARTLGLSFEQFGRAALLAQGAFAAFLQEKGEKRAELLEQMTGTEIYQRISKAAHEKAVSVKAALAELERAAAGVVVLDDEARESLRHRIADLDVAIGVSERHVEALASALRWHDERRRQKALVAEAGVLLTNASTHHDALEGLRALLVRVLEARELRPFVEAEHAARESEESAARTLEECVATSEEAAKEADALKTLVVERAAAQKKAQDEAERLAPSVARARTLDARLAEREERLREVAAEHSRATTSRDEAKAAEGTLALRVANDAALEAAERQWLEEHAGARRLASQWEQVEKSLSLYEADSARAKKLGAEHARLAAEVSAAQRAKSELTALRDSARQTLDESKAARDAAALAARGAHVDDADRTSRDRIAETRPRVEQLLTWLAEADVRGAKLVAQRDAEREAAEALEKARAEEQRLEAELSRENGAFEAANDALSRVQLAASLDEHRATLRDGEPCPLCGAEEHPYADKRLSSLLDAQRADVEAIKVRASDLTRLLDAQKRAVANGAQTVALIARELASLEEATAKAGVQIAEVAERLRLEAPMGVTSEAVSRLRDSLDEELRALREKEVRRSALARALEEKTSAFHEAEAAFSKTASALEEATGRERVAAKVASEREAEAAFAREACARLLTQMSDVFAHDDGWQARLEADASAFGAARSDEVTEVRRRETHLSALAEERARGAERKASLTATYEGLVLQAEKALFEFATEESTVVAIRTERAALFEGRATDQVEASWKAEVASSTAAFREAERTHATAEKNAQASRERLAAARSTLAHAEASHRAAHEKLAIALSSRNLSRDALSELLAYDDARVERSQTTVRDAELALTNAEVVLAEREKSLAEHSAHRPDDGLPDDLSAAIEVARTELRHAQDERFRTTAALERDDAARASQSEQRLVFEQARADAERWLALDSLIGSADGKKFRTFAQSLTLDGLLAYANHHLRDLAPRYRLERVPQHDMELQVVDADMGDEVRGTSSLSGGETFLVSLALALALSSLAAREVRIDTLFVDEGFGSLDPVTLDVALSALDSLQATGRQIGVISHVRALADKIGTQVRVERVGGGRSRLFVLEDA
jgi:exonuclease SbcC